MTTIADVAREAKVSVATVSRVLNDMGVVRPDTAKRVYAAVEKLSYEPNLLARNFRKSESKVVLILSPNMSNPYYAHILAGIGDVSNEMGYSALICNTAENSQREKEALDMLTKRRADGAILMAVDMACNWLGEFAGRFPIVQCSEFVEGIDVPRVSVDNYKAAREAVDHLVCLGHTRIATITSTNQYMSTFLRLKGYRDKLEENNIPVLPEYIAYAARDYSFASGKQEALKLLSMQPRPTAIFCISDTLALGAIIGAGEMGLRVPEDVSVIGFDDVDYTTMFHPYITTIAQPCYDLGREAGRLLYQQLEGHMAVPERLLDHRLIIRESTDSPLY